LRRTGLIIGAAVVALVLLAGVAYAVLRVFASGDDDTYSRRDNICGLIDPAPLAALSLAERRGAGRTSERGDEGAPYARCDLGIQSTAGDTMASNTLRVTASYHRDAQGARNAFRDEWEFATAGSGSVRTAMDGLGDEAMFATGTLSSDNGSTATDFTVTARHGNLLVIVHLGSAWNTTWDHATVRNTLVPVVRDVFVH
jgi:hypothetical protein